MSNAAAYIAAKKACAEAIRRQFEKTGEPLPLPYQMCPRELRDSAEAVGQWAAGWSEALDALVAFTPEYRETASVLAYHRRLDEKPRGGRLPPKTPKPRR
jgi:hypothetical protein